MRAEVWCYIRVRDLGDKGERRVEELQDIKKKWMLYEAPITNSHISSQLDIRLIKGTNPYLLSWLCYFQEKAVIV